jgi:hypothetical protein
LVPASAQCRNTILKRERGTDRDSSASRYRFVVVDILIEAYVKAAN